MITIEHRVRERAYFIWEDEGRMFGRAEAHWCRAEAEIAAETAGAALEVKRSASVAQASATPEAKPVAKALSKPLAAAAGKAAAGASAKANGKAAGKAPGKITKGKRGARATEAGIGLH